MKAPRLPIIIATTNDRSLILFLVGFVLLILLVFFVFHFALFVCVLCIVPNVSTLCGKV